MTAVPASVGFTLGDYRVPIGWDASPIGELFHIQQGKALSAAVRTAPIRYPFLRTANVLWGALDLTNVDQMGLSDQERAKLRLRTGDLLVCEGGEIGRAAMWDGSMEECYFQNHIHRLRPSNDHVEPAFYVYWLQFAFTRLGVYEGTGTKTTIANLSRGRLANLLVPVPPLDEQQRVARILGTIQAAIRTLDCDLDARLKLKRSLVATQFDLPEYAEIECRALCEVLSVGIVVRPVQYYCDSGVIALRSLNVREDELDLTNTVQIRTEAHCGSVAKSALRPGDVVIVRTGYPGTSAVIPSDLTEVNCIDLVFARPGPRIRPEFLSRFFNSSSGRKQALRAKTGLAQQHLNVAAVGRTTLPLPPLSVQDEIVERLRSVDASITAAREKRRALDAAFESALYSLMTAPA